MISRRVQLLTLVLVFCAGLWAVSAVQSGGSGSKCSCAEEAAELIAARIKKNLNGEKSVFLRDFTGFRSGNVGFPKLIGDELKKKHGVTVEEKADVDIRGSITSIKKNGTIIGYKVMFQVVFKNGNDTKNDSIEVLNHNEGLALLAETGQSRPDPKKDNLEPPDTDPNIANGTRVYPRPGALFSIEILVDSDGTGYKPRKVGLDANGFPKIEFKIGELYAVKIYNDIDTIQQA